MTKILVNDCPYFGLYLMYSRTSSVHRAFETMHSASLREAFPGETQVMLDYSGHVPSYDTDLVPSLVPRRESLERWNYRVAGISLEDIKRVKDRLAQVL